MGYLWSCSVLSTILLTVKFVHGVEVQPSPVATVTEGATLWLTCTYDLTGGTLGQLQWKDKDNVNVARVTPTANPQCSALSDNYSIDCSNLVSNEVRLGILNPVHGDTYSCTVYLSDFTLIGSVSTQVFVVVPVNRVIFTPPVSDTVLVTPGNSHVYTCVTGSCRPAARIEWYKDGVNITTQTGSVSSTGGDKFVTASSLTLTGTRSDTTPATVQCRASNVDGMSPVVSVDKTFVVQWPPDGSPVITGYTSVTILYVNDTLPLRCRQSGGNPRATLTWSGVCGGILPTNSNTQTEAVSDITITVRKGYNQATCTCVSSHPQPQSQDRTRVTFTVHFGSDNVNITGNRVIVADGINTLTLNCITQEYNRHVHITWYNGTTQTPNTAVVTNTSGTYGGYISTQILQLTPDRYQDGNVVRCLVQNEDMTIGPTTSSVTLNLYYHPSSAVSVTVNPTTEGRENSTVDLTCEVTGGKPTPSLQWTCPPSVSTTGPITGSQGDRYTSVITVALTRQANNQRCNCIGSQADTTWTGSVQSPVFTVRFGPNRASITGNRVIVADGTNTLTLNCTTQEYNKHVHITWYNGTTQVPNTAVVTNTSGTYGGYISTQFLQLTPDRHQNGNVIWCSVQNADAIIAETTDAVTLGINYRPYLTLTPTPGVNVIEGGELEIRCDVDSNPPSSITWTKVGGQLPVTSDVTSGIFTIRTTNRTDRGTYQCTAENSVSREQESINIDIHYPPDIRVTYTNTTYTSPDRTFTCVPDGNPDTYRFGDWRHISEDGTEIRQLTGSSNITQSILTLPEPGVTQRYQDTGYYICKVSNDIPEPSSYRSSSVFFVVEAPPVINIPTNTAVVRGQIGKSVTIAVDFYSRPGVSSSDVTWTRGSGEFLLRDTFVKSLSVRPIDIPFYGIDIQVKGYVSVLNINNLATEDLGDYTVTIKNSIGIGSYTVTIISTGPPLPPLYLLQKHVTSSSITVQWSPVREEVLSQTFVIGYRSDASTIYTDSDAIPDSKESVMSYTIERLAPDTFYHIRLYTQNEFGMSETIYLNSSTTRGDGDELISTRVALICVSTIFAVVVFTAVTIFVLLRMRKIASVKRTKTKANQDCGIGQRSGPDKYFLNESNQQSTYEDLNLENISPPSVYEDIQERNQRLAGDTSGGNTYEVLGRKAAPNVYEQLSKDT